MQQAATSPMVDLRAISFWVVVRSLLCVLILSFPLFESTAFSAGQESAAVGQSFESPKPPASRDVYYKTADVVAGPRAPQIASSDYARIERLPLGESRLVIWILGQQQTYWGGFVLGGLFIAVLFEFIGLSVRNRAAAARYDSFAHEVLRLVGAALAVAAVCGSLLLAGLVVLYRDLLNYLLTLFTPFLIAGLVLLVLFPISMWLYGATWKRMIETGRQWSHLALGLFGAVLGTLVLLLVNGWSSFMLSPAGVDEAGHFLGNYWHLIHTATWNPSSLHRVFGNIVFAAAVLAAYAAYRAMTSAVADRKAYYDRFSFASLLVMIFALMPIPFEGYWLSREIYAYRQQLGITMFGGLLAWLGIVLVSLVAALFLVINYYVWQRIDVAPAGAIYRPHAKYIFALLALCAAVYVTPHTMIMTPLELLQVGGQQHQVLGNYGVESAKQPAINMMTLLTAWSLLVWSWSCRGDVFLSRRMEQMMGGFFIAAAANIVWLGIYGYFVPANVRVGLSVPMVVTTLTAIVAASILIVKNLKKSESCDWAMGTLSVRGHYAVFFLAFVVTWTLGLGGYRRSALRLFWHVNEIVRDTSPWAYTHTIGFATNVISLNALIFWGSFLVLVWLMHRVWEVDVQHPLSRGTS